MGRKILTFIVAALLLLTGMIAVSAESFDDQRTGSISVTLTEQQEDTPIVGAELNLYYVATVNPVFDGRLSYVYTEPFDRLEVSVDDPTLIAKLDAFVLQNDVQATKLTTDATGKANSGALPLGLYYFRQMNQVEGYAPCTPFLVTVPGQNGDSFTYDVNASPKTEVAKLASISIKKVWNTDDSTQIADSVTVQLLRNEVVLETAILSAENNWQVTFDQMPESDAYSVKEINVPKGFTATYKQTGYDFTVTNTATLAQTGQLIWPIPVLAISGMLFIAAGIALLQKKRNTNE